MECKKEEMPHDCTGGFLYRLVLMACLLFPAGLMAQKRADSSIIKFNQWNGLIKRGIANLNYDRDTLRLFYNFEWEPTDRVQAYYITMAYKTKEGWVSEDYNIYESRMMQYTSYSDRNLTILNGPYFSFYANDSLNRSGNHLAGERDGKWEKHYENGVLESVVSYVKGVPIGERWSYYPSGKLKEREVLDTAGRGTLERYREDGTLAQRGKYEAAMLKDSVWVSYSSNGKVTFLEKYGHDLLTSVRCFNPDGTVRDSCKATIMPEFPGGVKALLKFLGKNIKFPKGYRFINASSAKVIVTFVVGKDGFAKDFTVVKHLAEPFEEEVIRVLKAMPRWNPGMDHNDPVDVYYTLPVNFKK